MNPPQGANSPTPNPVAHTPTPWSYVKDNPVFGKDRCWGFIKSDACRHVVVGCDEFTRTSFGETETYAGVKIAPHDADFIIEACNSHAQLVARVAQIQEAAQQGQYTIRSLIHTLDTIDADERGAARDERRSAHVHTNEIKQAKEAHDKLERALLSPVPQEGQKK